YFLLDKLTNIHNVFQRVKGIFQFLFIAMFMCAVSCTTGATAILLGGIISSSNYFDLWFTWWIGDLSGVLIVTPLILVFASSKNLYNHTWNVKKIIEGFALFLSLILVSGVLFENWFHPKFI